MADIIPLFKYDEDREKLRGKLQLGQAMAECLLKDHNKKQTILKPSQCDALIGVLNAIKREWWRL